MTRQRLLLTFTLSSLLAVNACGVDTDGLFGSPTGSSSSSTGNNGGSSAGGSSSGGEDASGGSAMSCTEATDCPGETSDCQAPDCDAGSCITKLEAEGTACDDDGGEVCDGQGACVKNTGASCDNGDDCLSGFCADGYCCDTVCTDLCEACNITGKEGSCSPLTGTDPDRECAPNGVCDAANACASGEHVWSHQANGDDYSIVSDIASDSQNNVLIVGHFDGTINLGGSDLSSSGTLDSFVAKFDASGNHLWSLSFGGSNYTYGNAIAVDQSNNVYVAGSMDGTVNFGGDPLVSQDYDLFVVKYSATGEHIWSKRFGGADPQYGLAIATATTGDVVVGGRFDGTIDFGGTPLASNGNWDVYIAKLDANGTPIFGKQFGDTQEQRIDGVAVNRSNDDIIITGTNEGTVQFGNDQLMTTGDRDIFIARFDNQGAHLWSQQYGNEDGQNVDDVSVDDQGRIAIAGHFKGALNFGGTTLSTTNEAAYVAHLDANGNHLFSRAFDNGDALHGHAVAHDANGQVLVIGDGAGQINFGGSDLNTTAARYGYVAKYGPFGTHLWSRVDGTTGKQHLGAVAIDTTGAVLVAGNFTAALDFGNNPLTSAASAADGLFAKFTP